MKKSAFLAAAIAAAVPAQAFAVTGNVQFDGSVSNTCAITVNTAGTLATNVGQTVLGSEQAGGAAGTATIVTTSAAYQVSADAPTAWTAFPTGGDTNVTFAANYATTGATTISKTSGATQSALATGSTDVNVNMSATKSSGSFPTGTYGAVVTLRCE